jgi:hypothetical protein
VKAKVRNPKQISRRFRSKPATRRGVLGVVIEQSLTDGAFRLKYGKRAPEVSASHGDFGVTRPVPVALDDGALDEQLLRLRLEEAAAERAMKLRQSRRV